MFTVLGADGRRITRGAGESEARNLAHKVNEQTGETITLVDEQSGEETVLFPAEKKSGKKGDNEA